MAKKKIYKDDGVTEDFDVESKELDEATAGGLVTDEGEAKADALGLDAGKADAGAAAQSASSDSTAGGESKEDAPAQASSDASAPSAAPSEPDAFTELHGDVSELADHLEGDAIDALKEAGNKLTPAVSKLHGLEDRFHHFGDEVKNRIAHAKTKLVEAMGALELIFKRGK